MRFLNRTVEEGSWTSDRPSESDMKPLCGIIEIHAIYSGSAKALRFELEGKELGRLPGTDVRFSWDTKSWPEARYRAEFQALAEDGRVLASFPLTLETRIEEDHEPPTVTITSPPPSAVVRGVTTVKVDARDDHKVSQVLLLVDGDRLDERTAFPYSFDWDTRSLPRGSRHRLDAQASDPSGNLGASEPVFVTVSNPESLLVNSELAGTPPSPWRLFGAAAMDHRHDADRGEFLHLTLPANVGEGGLEQALTTRVATSGIVLSAAYRPSLAVQAAGNVCSLTLLDGRDQTLVSSNLDRPVEGPVAWVEKTMPVPTLEAGPYRLRVTLPSAGSATNECDLAKLEMVIP